MDKKIKRILDNKRKTDRLRMYVLCRRDLGKTYGLVQGAHAVAQYLLHNKTKWNNGTLIMLAVKDANVLFNWEAKLMFKKEKKFNNFCVFLEPDLDDQHTALAIVLDVNDGKIFRKLELF